MGLSNWSVPFGSVSKCLHRKTYGFGDETPWAATADIVGTIHVPAIMGGGAASWMTPMVHTTGLAGGAFVLAGVHEGS